MAVTSSLQFFELQAGGAALAPETKTPATRVAVANMTATCLSNLFIVEPPLAVFQSKSKIDFDARPHACRSSTRLSRRKVS
jgi:hypothetical protein